LHTPDKPARGKAPPEPAFDAFDDEAEASTPHEPAHGYVPVATTYAPNTGKRLRTLAIVFAVVLAAGFFVVHHLRGREDSALEQATAARAEQPSAVEVVRVEMAPPIDRLSLPGEVRGWYTSTIYARVSGYVAKWIVDIGDRVTKDQVLATLDTPELDSQLEAAQHQLSVADAEVKVREADADFAKTTYDRWQGSPKGVVSDQEREDKKAQYAVSIAQLNAARARVSQGQANVDRLTFMAGFKKVTAPYDGVVTERRIDIGDLVSAGNTLLYGVTQYDQVRAFVNVPQAASIDIGVGTVVNITVGELSKRVFEGTVTRTSDSIDPRARTLRVEVDLENKDHALQPGMYIQAQFHLKSANFVQVPASAMLFRSGGPQVAIVGDDGIVKFQDVTIGRDNGNFIEIASGVSQGQRVALNISSQIADGDRVTVSESNQTAAR
jgi:RND family efflux transporter MFP subunit